MKRKQRKIVKQNQSFELCRQAAVNNVFSPDVKFLHIPDFQAVASGAEEHKK